MPNFMTWFQSSKTRNIMIILVILIVAVLLFGIYWARRDVDTEVAPATVPKVPERIEFDPGAKGISKEYLKTLLESEKEAAERAKQEGRSSVPVIIRGVDEEEAVGRELTETDECYRQCVDCCRGRVSTGALLNKWVKEGNVSAEAAAEISKLQDEKVSVSEYAENLNRLVREGKITPEQAQQLLEAYRRESEAPSVTDAEAMLDQMVSTGAIDPGVAANLRDLQKEKKSVNEYARALNQLVQEGKLTPEQAKQLLDAYSKEMEEAPPPVEVKVDEHDKILSQLQAEGKIPSDALERLENLRSAKVSAGEYAEELNNLVKEGRISPETAEKLLAAYRKTYGDVRVTAPDAGFAEMQRAQQERDLQVQREALREQRALIEQQKRVAETRKKQEVAAELQKQQQALQKAMGAQAQTLFTSWNVTPQVYVGGGEEKKEKQDDGSEVSSNPEGQNTQNVDIKDVAKGAILVKAGDIMFAVLETSVNSDQPGPIMATIVSGRFKGGKLLGTLTKTPDKQRVMLQFNLLNMPEFTETIRVNAVAINPDTARTAIASDVDNHYLLRYGSLFAANFIYGYAQATQSSGSTTTDETSGDKTTTNPTLSGSQKVVVGLGEVGNKLNEMLTEVYTKEPTVRVDAGVGLGILFLSDIKR